MNAPPERHADLIGRSVPRVEDERFLTGAGRYVGDIDLPGQAHAALLLSPHPHAEIASIDVSAALAAPGVLAVLTGRDAAADGLGGIPCTQLAGDGGALPGVRIHQPVLAAGRVRHVGDRVAMVVAETAAQARDAAERIDVEYLPLPFVTRADEAVAGGAPQVWEDAQDNVCFATEIGDAISVDESFRAAAHTVSVNAHNTRVAAAPLECRAALGEWRDGRYTIYTGCQKPHAVRQVLANFIFDEPEADFHVICPDVGGGFGLKGTVYPEDALVAWAARKLGRPVKWEGTRGDAFLNDLHGRDQVTAGELALDADGRVLALRAAVVTNLGAYLSISALVSTLRGTSGLTGPYAVPAAHVAVKAAFTHTATTGPYRGAGVPESVFLLERLMDKAAREIGVDPVELRRRNLIARDAMPCKTPLAYGYDCGDFGAVLERAVELADVAGFAARRAASHERGRVRGLGVGFYVFPITAFSERMEIRVDSGGGVTVLAGTFSYGQGHETVYAQMVADWFGVPMDRIRVVQGDTDRVSMGRGSFGSRSVSMGGAALKLAADEVIEKGKRVAAHLMEASPQDVVFENGVFSLAGTDRAVPFAQVAAVSFAPLGLPPGTEVGLEAAGHFAGPFNFPNGCHVCEVEIDPETGALEIARYSAVDDVGRAVNPVLTHGQIHGGIAQGLGQARGEQVAYDPETGQCVTGSFLDYWMPRADDLPSFAGELMEIATTANPLGVKGAGENGVVPSTPALINAVLDALAPLGVTDIDLPATPERIWRAIREA